MTGARPPRRIDHLLPNAVAWAKLGEENMAKSAGISRRSFMSHTVGAGAVLSSNFAAAVPFGADRQNRSASAFSIPSPAASPTRARTISTACRFISTASIGPSPGEKIEVIKEDDQFNPQIGLQKAKKLVRKRQRRHARWRPSEQRGARGVELR